MTDHTDTRRAAMTDARAAELVKRYDMTTDAEYAGDTCVSSETYMVEIECGDWVKYEDHQHALREAERRVWRQVVTFCEKQAVAHASNFHANLILNELAEEFERMSQGKKRKLVLNNNERQAAARAQEGG